MRNQFKIGDIVSIKYIPECQFIVTEKLDDIFRCRGIMGSVDNRTGYIREDTVDIWVTIGNVFDIRRKQKCKDFK